jgi:hypothetical protein
MKNFTQTKLFPWQCAQITKAFAKVVTLPLVLSTQIWVTMVESTVSE